jgi:ADP-ribosyl-[dinitrogen reductase] hydrolase
MTEAERARGCLLGLACGDALGRPVEFKSERQISERYGEVTEMLAQGTHRQPAGTITDDTEMALCIAESLVAKGGFDRADVAERFVAWLASGPFDVGLMTRDAVERIREGTPPDEAGHEVWRERPEGSNAGNGSVMRCAPHGIAFRHDEAELVRVSRASSAITHADPRCQWGCVLLNHTLAGLVQDEADPLGVALDSADGAPAELRDAVGAVHAVVDGERDPEALEGELSTSGYVVDALQAGLFYGLTADTAERAVVEAVNRGDDTDTVGAIAGAVAGARFGADELPNRWLREVDEAARLRELSDGLLELDGGDRG